jgi:anti-sigma factor RsiW
MKNEEELCRELIHKALDGDAGPEEELALMDRLNRRPDLKEEFDDTARLLRLVETRGRRPVPPFFTEQVMRRLPRGKEPLGRRVRDFFLKGRTLQWNMAAALAGVALIVVFVAQAPRPRERTAENVILDHRNRQVTVTMNLYAPEARRVAVAGTFNKWNTDADVLTKGENGLWTINIPLEPGAYTYMFVVDGKAWVVDPKAQAYDDDGFGGRNSVMRVRI